MTVEVGKVSYEKKHFNLWHEKKKIAISIIFKALSYRKLRKKINAQKTLSN